MRARASGVIGAVVLLPAAICICLGLAAGGCKKEKAPENKMTEDALPSPESEKRPAGPVVAGNPSAVVVRVYGKTLTRGQIDEQVDHARSSQQLRGMSPDMAAKHFTDNFVAQCVLEHEAEVRNIVVDDKEREAELTKLKASLPGGMPIEQVVAMSGMDMVGLTNQITQELKIRKLLDLQTTNIPPPTAEEVLSFYSNTPAAFQIKEYAHVRHILVAFDRTGLDAAMPGEEAAKTNNEAANAEKKKKAESLREELVKGADFAAHAKANSDCPSKSKGGDLGRLTKGQTVPEFEKAAFSQDINAIGPVVETKFGYHIIQVLSRGEAGLLPLKEVESEISEYLLGGKRRQAVMAFVDKLKAGAKVEYAK